MDDITQVEEAYSELYEVLQKARDRLTVGDFFKVRLALYRAWELGFWKGLIEAKPDCLSEDWISPQVVSQIEEILKQKEAE
jgi:hypothetical protein